MAIDCSAHVSGKAQKYAHMGPREFVPFLEKLEFNIENIKRACLKHFAPTVGNDVVCDILAGEQGPSCKCHNQIPDVKVIHVRFLPDTSDHLSDVNNAAGAKKGRQLAARASLVLSQLTIGKLRPQNPVPHLPWKSNLVLLNSENPQKTPGLPLVSPFKVSIFQRVCLYRT